MSGLFTGRSVLEQDTEPNIVYVVSRYEGKKKQSMYGVNSTECMFVWTRIIL